MSEPLYSIDILRLAAATADFPRLATPDATVERRSVTCGSRISVDLMIDNAGQVIAYGHQVKACALGQAAATLFARHVVGLTAADIATAHDELSQWLADGDAPRPLWPDIGLLERARGYSARHGSIRLAFEATADAMQQVTR